MSGVISNQPTAAASDAQVWPRDEATLHQSKRLRLISMGEVCRRVLFSRVHVYRMMAAGTFPRPVKLGENRIAFVEEEIDDFIRARIAQRDAAAVPAVNLPRSRLKGDDTPLSEQLVSKRVRAAAVAGEG
jgi:prophage regulatory protein